MLTMLLLLQAHPYCPLRSPSFDFYGLTISRPLKPEDWGVTGRTVRDTANEVRNFGESTRATADGKWKFAVRIDKDPKGGNSLELCHSDPMVHHRNV